VLSTIVRALTWQSGHGVVKYLGKSTYIPSKDRTSNGQGRAGTHRVQRIHQDAAAQIPSCPPASRLIDGSCPSRRPTRHDVVETASSDDRSASLKLKFVARSVVLLPLYQSSVPRVCGVSRYLHIRTIRSIQFKLVSLDRKLTQKIPPSKDHVSFKSCLPGLPPASEPHAKLVVAAHHVEGAVRR
jgi:hypothetical protein